MTATRHGPQIVSLSVKKINGVANMPRRATTSMAACRLILDRAPVTAITRQLERALFLDLDWCELDRTLRGGRRFLVCGVAGQPQRAQARGLLAHCIQFCLIFGHCFLAFARLLLFLEEASARRCARSESILNLELLTRQQSEGRCPLRRRGFDVIRTYLKIV